MTVPVKHRWGRSPRWCWYFGHGLVPVAIVFALAIWGCKNVLGKQPLLPEGALEE